MRAVTAAFLCCAAGCGRGADVVAVVDGVDVRAADVRVGGGRADVIAQEQLAALARRDRLDRDADVAATVRKAERDALASALLDQTLREATTEKALRAAYEERKETLQKKRVHVAHIVLGDGVDADSVLARLAAGEDFAAVARAVSVDAPTAQNGGELPPVFEDQIDAAFFAAAWKLQAGETSGLLVTPWGRHVLKALEAPAQVTPSYEEARGTLSATLSREAATALRERASAVPVRAIGEGN